MTDFQPAGTALFYLQSQPAFLIMRLKHSDPSYSSADHDNTACESLVGISPNGL